MSKPERSFKHRFSTGERRVNVYEFIAGFVTDTELCVTQGYPPEKQLGTFVHECAHAEWPQWNHRWIDKVEEAVFRAVWDDNWRWVGKGGTGSLSELCDLIADTLYETIGSLKQAESIRSGEVIGRLLWRIGYRKTSS